MTGDKPMTVLLVHCRKGSEQARKVASGDAIAHLARELSQAGFGSKRKMKRALRDALTREPRA